MITMMIAITIKADALTKLIVLMTVMLNLCCRKRPKPLMNAYRCDLTGSPT